MIYQSERVLLRDRTVTRRQNFWGVSKSQQQSYTLSTTMAFFTRDCWRQGQVRVTSLMMIYFIHNSMLLLLSDNLLNVSDRTAGGPMLESAPQIQETFVAPTNLLATKLLIGSWYKWACHKKTCLFFCFILIGNSFLKPSWWGEIGVADEFFMLHNNAISKFQI